MYRKNICKHLKTIFKLRSVPAVSMETWSPDKTAVHFHKSLRDDASKMAAQENPETTWLKCLCYIV